MTFAAPSSVKCFGECAFQYTNIVELDIPDGVVDIDKYCFGGCSRLSYLTFGQNTRIKRIAQGAFLQTRLTNDNVVMPPKLKRRLLGSHVYKMAIVQQKESCCNIC